MLRSGAILLTAVALVGCGSLDSMWGGDRHETKVPPPPNATTERPGMATPTNETVSGTTVVIREINASGMGKELGTITLSDVPGGGLTISPNLTGLPPGEHGFHLHQNASCDPAQKDGKMSAGEAAGPHYDPDKTGKHAGPAGNGHKGDTPLLTVAADGSATRPVTAPRLSLADAMGRAFIIHEGGDNYADQPKPLGGGGPRIACGIVQ